MTAVLEIEGLTVIAFGRTVFDRFALRVDPGEVVVLVGPNGSGKSTLLDVVAGVRPALRGSIQVDGTLGYAADRPALPGELRVDEWLSLIAGIRGVKQRPAAFDVADLRGQPLSKLSLGETRRVLLASAFAGPPRLVLLDEPTNGLDAARRAELERRIRAHARGGGGVVVATHDRDLARLGREIRLHASESPEPAVGVEKAHGIDSAGIGR